MILLLKLMMGLTMIEIAKIYSSHITQLLTNNNDRLPYFITTTFRNFKTLSPRSFPNAIRHALASYDHLYRHLTSRLMTNFSKKPFFHPVTFDFVDMPNSRSSFELNFIEPITPHIHSIYLIHEVTLDHLEALRAMNFRTVLDHPALHSVRTIDAQPIEPSTLHNVVSYAAKLLNNHEAVRLADDAPLFTQHPQAQFERIRDNRRSF